MWKNYSADYIKNNRASGISVRAAAFLAALFLSFLCCLFYNFWLDSIEGAKLEDGDWHARITGEISEKDLAVINRFANVERAVVDEESSGDQEKVTDVYFYHKKTIYQDMSALVKVLGLEEDAVEYNYQLLSLYFVRIPGDDKPRLLLPAYLAIVVIVCFSLILIIHNSFAVSMNSRVHQFGIFAGIGATPGQILTCLVQEAFVLAAVPILAGILTGIVFSFGTVWGMSRFASNFVGGRQMAFECHPALLMLVMVLSIFTVLVSAWLPARKLSRLTPLEAIRGTDEWQLKNSKMAWKKHSPVLSALFGMEGELAGNAIRAQKKALYTTSLSFTLAFFGYMIMQCFWTLSGISTNHTYFEKYQDAWDVMATVRDTRIEDFELTGEIRRLAGADSSVVYQKAEAVCILPQQAQSKELLEMGGLKSFSEDPAYSGEGPFQIKAPMIVLDDESFLAYCEQAGAASGLDGAIVLNRLWDSVNSNFRYPKYIPYVKEDMETVVLRSAEAKGEQESENMTKITVLACTQEYPLLREEYGKSDCPLVLFLPLSLWKGIKEQTGGAERDTYVRVLAKDNAKPDAVHALEDEITQIISREYEVESENRIQEKADNDKMTEGYQWLSGAFCVLPAMIGIAHVFSHTLGFLRQRKREFARYMSVGLTPEGMRKMFCIEALVIVGRPVLVTLALTTVASAVMIRASYLDPAEFIQAAPVVPILAFVLTVFGFVALAYYLGGKKIMSVSPGDVLRDDTMM